MSNFQHTEEGSLFHIIHLFSTVNVCFFPFRCTRIANIPPKHSLAPTPYMLIY